VARFWEAARPCRCAGRHRAVATHLSLTRQCVSPLPPIRPGRSGDCPRGRISTTIYYLAATEFDRALHGDSAVLHHGAGDARRGRLAVTGLLPGEQAAVSSVNGPDLSVPPSGVVVVDNGRFDTGSVIVTRAEDSSERAATAIIRRGVAFGESLLPIDFNGPEAVLLDSVLVTIEKVTEGGSAVAIRFQTAPPWPVSRKLDDQFAGAGRRHSTWMRHVPASAQRAGEGHQVTACTGVRSTTCGHVFSAGSTPLTVRLGAELAAPSVTAAGRSPRVRLPAQRDYDKGVSALFWQENAAEVEVIVTRAYLGAVPTVWDFAVPNLAALPEWDSRYALASGEVNWIVEAFAGWEPWFGPPITGQAQSGRSSRREGRFTIR
jgi:hypothetical protein